MTDDGSFRVITLRTTETAGAAIAAQKAGGLAARWLGELITGTILVRETMAPQYRVQGLLAGADGEVCLVADSFPDGGTRGLVRLPRGQADLSPGHVRRLQMMRSLPTGEPQQGLVGVPGGGNISTALMIYMTDSEQVASVLAVGCVMEEGAVRASGGYIVQLLPEVGTEPLQKMVEHLSGFQQIDRLLEETDSEPRALMDAILQSIPYTELEERPLQFKCRCSEANLLASLATIGREEIEEMISAGKVLEIDCDFCNKSYRISPARLKTLLVQAC